VSYAPRCGSAAPKQPVSRYDMYPSTTAVRRLLADLRHNRPTLAPLAPAIRFADVSVYLHISLILDWMMVEERRM
jgi:hypothetical protein